MRSHAICFVIVLLLLLLQFRPECMHQRPPAITDHTNTSLPRHTTSANNPGNNHRRNNGHPRNPFYSLVSPHNNTNGRQRVLYFSLKSVYNYDPTRLAAHAAWTHCSGAKTFFLPQWSISSDTTERKTSLLKSGLFKKAEQCQLIGLSILGWAVSLNNFSFCWFLCIFPSGSVRFRLIWKHKSFWLLHHRVRVSRHHVPTT